MHAPTGRLEAHLKLLPGKALKHNSAVHLHLGTADIPARVLMAGQAAPPPGGEAVVQLVLDRQTGAANGDRFVLRDPSGRLTVGGGRIIDPFVGGDRRAQSARPPISAALQSPDPAKALAALLALPAHEVDTTRFERCFNLEPAAAQTLYREAGTVLLGSAPVLALPAARVEKIADEILETLKNFHRAHPEAAGMALRELRAALSAAISPSAFLALLKDLSERRLATLSGSIAKLAGHAAVFSSSDGALWQKLLLWLEERGARPFTARELADELRTNETAIDGMLHRRRSSGEVWRVTDKRFLLRKQVAALAASAARLADEAGGKGFSAAQYRDAIGTGRNWAIQILEFFDSIGITHRNGDLRKMRRDYQCVVGEAEPYLPQSRAERD
jgi:selenocysteine-specific elongation factor